MPLPGHSQAGVLVLAAAGRALCSRAQGLSTGLLGCSHSRIHARVQSAASLSPRLENHPRLPYPIGHRGPAPTHPAGAAQGRSCQRLADTLWHRQRSLSGPVVPACHVPLTSGS